VFGHSGWGDVPNSPGGVVTPQLPGIITGRRTSGPPTANPINAVTSLTPPLAESSGSYPCPHLSALQTTPWGRADSLRPRVPGEMAASCRHLTAAPPPHPAPRTAPRPVPPAACTHLWHARTEAGKATAGGSAEPQPLEGGEPRVCTRRQPRPLTFACPTLLQHRDLHTHSTTIDHDRGQRRAPWHRHRVPGRNAALLQTQTNGAV
jgi:hypothetical protein